MRFEALSRAEQRYEVDGALPSILAAIDRPTPTVIIVARVARLLDADPAYITGLVIGIAREHPQARQDGETFKRYGKTMRRWVWYPLAGSVTPEVMGASQPAKPDYALYTDAKLEDMCGQGDREAALELARRTAAAMVDVADW